MSQIETQAPEVVRIAVEHQQSFKERWTKRAALLGIGALAAVSLDIPNPFGVVGDVVDGIRDVAGDIWDGAGDILGKGKDGADGVVADLSRREAQPLIVDPKDVVMGAVEGRTAFGMAEREYHIEHASKKWNSPIPRNDEWININDATYVGEAYVPGDIKVTGTKKDITITLPGPMRDMDVSLRNQPEIINDAQILSEVGQIPGAETNPATALRELHAYAEKLEANDSELMHAAACWGVASAEGLLVPALGLAGFEVLQGAERGVDGNPENDLRLTVRGTLDTNMDSSDPDIFITRENCDEVLEDRIPHLQDETFVLPRQTIEEHKLEQEDK